MLNEFKKPKKGTCNLDVLATSKSEGFEAMSKILKMAREVAIRNEVAVVTARQK